MGIVRGRWCGAAPRPRDPTLAGRAGERAGGSIDSFPPWNLVTLYASAFCCHTCLLVRCLIQSADLARRSWNNSRNPKFNVHVRTSSKPFVRSRPSSSPKPFAHPDCMPAMHYEDTYMLLKPLPHGCVAGCLELIPRAAGGVIALAGLRCVWPDLSLAPDLRPRTWYARHCPQTSENFLFGFGCCKSRTKS